MKTYINKIVILVLVLWQAVAKACEACDLQQPKITRGLTHGAGPKSMWDWVAVAIIMLISIATVYYFIKYLIKPDAKKRIELKNNVLDF